MESSGRGRDHIRHLLLLFFALFHALAYLRPEAGSLPQADKAVASLRSVHGSPPVRVFVLTSEGIHIITLKPQSTGAGSPHRAMFSKKPENAESLKQSRLQERTQLRRRRNSKCRQAQPHSSLRECLTKVWLLAEASGEDEQAGGIVVADQ